jgi:hypothetical protein
MNRIGDKNTKNAGMKTIYRVTTHETGEILLKKRKIAKAFRRWLRENGFTYTSDFFVN